MNKEWNDVRLFHEKFGSPHPDVPTMLTEKRARARADWMEEEIGEFLEARSLVDQADAMIDLIYFALGTMVEMGVRPDELFAAVQKANMDKLWPDGKPHYREDGKIIKPAEWQPPEPELERIVARMIEEAASRRTQE